MTQLNKTLELYLVKKAPALPKGIKETLVKLAPWLAIIGVVVSIPGILVLFGLSSMMSGLPYSGYTMMGYGGGFSISVLFVIATMILEILAVPGLMKRKLAGWNFLYWAVWVSAVYSLLSYQIVGMVIGTLISLYLLFQVKSYYKK